MGYFRELPTLQYLSPLKTRNSALEYIDTKNIFKRVKLREDFQSTLTNFDKYQILDGKRPDQVAKELYNSETLDWVVLISAGITNVRDQWPLSDKDIFYFAEKIYGSSMNETRFYETKEVKDSRGRTILPKGQVVDHNFKSPRPKTDTDPTNSYVKFWDDGIVDSGTGRKGTLVTEFNVTQSISNYQYHVRLNDKKRGIYVLKPTYLQQFLLDSRKLMKYSRASQTVSDTVKRVTNIRLLSP